LFAVASETSGRISFICALVQVSGTALCKEADCEKPQIFGRRFVEEPPVYKVTPHCKRCHRGKKQGL
jgi:hypothetical protein